MKIGEINVCYADKGVRYISCKLVLLVLRFAILVKQPYNSYLVFLHNSYKRWVFYFTFFHPAHLYCNISHNVCLPVASQLAEYLM